MLFGKAREGAKARKRKDKAADYPQRTLYEEPGNYSMMLPGQSKRDPAKVSQEDNVYLRSLLAEKDRQNNQLLDLLAAQGIFPDMNNLDGEIAGAESTDTNLTINQSLEPEPYRKKVRDLITDVAKDETRDLEHLHDYANRRAEDLDLSMKKYRNQQRESKYPGQQRNLETSIRLRSVHRKLMTILASATGQFISERGQEGQSELDGDSLFLH